MPEHYHDPLVETKEKDLITSHKDCQFASYFHDCHLASYIATNGFDRGRMENLAFVVQELHYDNHKEQDQL